MSLLRNITTGLRSLFRKEQVDRELDEELRAYQEMAAEEKMKDGMSRKEALRAVRLERGSFDATKEIIRSAGWESIFVERSWSTSVKHPIGAGLVTILAFVVRFVLPLPFALDIYVHDTYRLVPIRVVSFWVLLVISAAWLVIAAFKLIRRTS